MIGKFIAKIVGSRNERLVKQLMKQITLINEIEPQFESLSNDEIKFKTTEFKDRIKNGEKLDSLLNEAFALVREAAKRTLGLRHYDVQLIGGMVLHQGKIAEMKTGEGKTLVATLPVYLNSLLGEGVHVITVNDYLAKRDAQWMRPVYEMLGLTVGVSVPGMSVEEKCQAYHADVTYGTNNEFGFDYLRDNMTFALEDRVQRKLQFAIVDEVDSILIDEARTPLIISGQTDDSPQLYIKIDKLIPKLKPIAEGSEEGDFTIDEKQKQVHLTESGLAHVEEILAKENLLEADQSLYDANNLPLLHHLNAALRAHILYKKDVDYIVRDREVIIVDEFTGRTLAGRRWSDGLHQAVEAKENVPIQKENQTLASITFQNYFRLYDKLSGMTGTADTEAYEFQSIYALEVVVIPTHQKMIRDDRGDLIFLTNKEKHQAILEDIKDCNNRKQPVLVGTTSIETSELIANLLKKEKIKHEVLNAKQHAREALIIAQAGMPGAVTIATNMAGRGTDIVLGGNYEVAAANLGDDATDEQVQQRKALWEQHHAEVIQAGGLHVIGTERHESRRIDNQLRGRSGRQGDPGSTRFYISLEDDLMRIFFSDKRAGLMQRIGLGDGGAIEHPLVSRAIEGAQRKVESHNFDIRKNLLEFDDVANDQRKVVYQQRFELMSDDDVSETIEAIKDEVISNLFDGFVPPESIDEQWNIAGLEKALETEYGAQLGIQKWLDQDSKLDGGQLKQKVLQAMNQFFMDREEAIGVEQMRVLEQRIMLYVLDNLWKEHLAKMDYLRQGIGLRGYAQKQPKQEYKRESFQLFQELLENIKYEVIKLLARVQVRSQEDLEAMQTSQKQDSLNYQHPQSADAYGQGKQQPAAETKQPYVRDGKKVGRNDPCPCGSGKKYKECHGKLA